MNTSKMTQIDRTGFFYDLKKRVYVICITISYHTVNSTKCEDSKDCVCLCDSKDCVCVF